MSLTYNWTIWRIIAVLSVFLILKPYVIQGDTEPRIINGTVAKSHNTKHQVSIRLKAQDYPFGSGHICGGSLIGLRKVLTAAHCVFDSDKKKYRKPKDFLVVMGTLNRSQRPNGTIVSDVTSIATLKTFDITTMRDDVAILFLKTGLPANKTHLTVQPIDLIDYNLPAGQICEVSGWGKTSSSNKNLPAELRTANVSIISKNVCSLSYTGAIKPGMICAGYMSGGRDACQGDSGGPLVYNGKLVGVVSWGTGCGQKNYPGIYADVNYYRQWIAKTNASLRLSWSAANTFLMVSILFLVEKCFI